jgi:Fe-S cluster assembly protein SufD
MMTLMKPTTQTISEQAFQFAQSLQFEKQEPFWLTVLKQTALSRFDALGFPTRHMEPWRFIDLLPILQQPFQSFEQHTLSSSLLQPFLLDECHETRLVFINGQFSETHSVVENIPPGVIITELTRAMMDSPDLVQRHLAFQLAKEEDAFAALNTMLFSQGAFVYIPENTTLERAIQILFVTDEGEAPAVGYPRILIVADRHAAVTVVHQSVSPHHTEGVYFNNALVEIWAHEGASVDYTTVQQENLSAYQMATTRTYLHQHSHVSLNSFAFGGALSRHYIHTTLLGESASCRLSGLSVLNDATEVHDYTVIEHAAKKCTSHQLYKGILEGHSRSEFDGSILIHPGASQSDAAQLNKNLLLSEDAKVYTRPQLRIDNDDVKCSHGATVGQLNPEECFYLTSRGLGSHLAKRLLILGFAGEIIEKLTIPSLKTYLAQQVSRNLQVENPRS